MAIAYARLAPPRRQPAAGFALAELALAALLLTLSAIWLAGRWQNRIDDAGAEATAAYLMTVRGAVQALLVRHFDTWTGQPPDEEGMESLPPEVLRQPWPLVFGPEVLSLPAANGGAGLLPPGFPAAPPLGEGVAVRIRQEGVCPGADCRLEAYVHTLAPLRKDAAAAYSPELVGAVMLATQGYGAHAPPGHPGRLRGALLDTENPLGEVAGVVAVTASLDATHFHQFVRQGDSRPVWLRNRLSVAGEMASRTGLRLDTAVVPGTPCPSDGLYARAVAGTLAQCLTGIWFERDRYVVQGWSLLAPGEEVPAPACPPGLQGFSQLGVAQLDVLIEGEAIDVKGRVEGILTGSGNSDAAGQVSVSGSFGGDLASTPDSRILLEQPVRVENGRLSMPGAGPDARAQVVYGCIQI
ncbi:MAG: hypothetical protein M0R28_11890 [Pigmentiphaga sp.]|nr:hypothetical protein [Pigmentiphaga sp.]